MDRAAPCDTGGVHNAVESIRDRGEHGADRGFVADVGRHELEPCAEILRRRNQIGADDGAALGQQPPCGRKTDAGCGSSNDERARTRAINADHVQTLAALRTKKCVLAVPGAAPRLESSLPQRNRWSTIRWPP